MIASTEPVASVWSCEQGVDFRRREKTDQCTGETLAGNGEHTLYLRRMVRSSKAA